MERADQFSPKLVVALVGSVIGFVVLIVGFRLVARKTCCVPRSSADDYDDPNSTLPFHNGRASPARGGPMYPTGSLVKFSCWDCLRTSRKRSPDDFHNASEDAPSPPPPYARPQHSGSFGSESYSLDGQLGGYASTASPTLRAPAAPPPAYPTSRPGRIPPTAIVRRS